MTGTGSFGLAFFSKYPAAGSVKLSVAGVDLEDDRNAASRGFLLRVRRWQP